MKSVFLCAAAIFVFVSNGNGATPSFQALGDLPESVFWSVAYGISGDGSTVVGDSRGASGTTAFYWRKGEGMVAFTGQPSSAYDVSRDGKTITGVRPVAGQSQGYVWKQETGVTMIGYLPGGGYSDPRDISGDGSVVVGYGSSSNGTKAFKWTASTGMIQLPDKPGQSSLNTSAYGISSDGRVIAGNISNGGGGHLWKDGGSPQLLSSWYSHPEDISGDDSTVIGYAYWYKSYEQAFSWTETTDMVPLGSLVPGGYSNALASSFDGSIIAGYAKGQSGLDEAFIWDKQHGMLSLKDVLSAGGLNLAGWRLSLASGISDDGTTIVGYGTNPDGYTEAWVATIPEPATVVLFGLGGIFLRSRK
jgi:probable HAF family extracellular repeat protein